jgi:uncharacterized RDD family membrane protein YckC
MAEAQRIGVSYDVKPHAYDPMTQPEYFEGVLSRRIVAWLIDVTIVVMLTVLAAVVLFVFGLLTLGLGWMLYFIFPAISTIIAVIYYGLCYTGAKSATLGMRAVDLEMRTYYGGPAYFLLGAVHAIFYWVSVSFLTPFILVVSLLNDRKRTLHDMLLGTIVVNNEQRAQAMRRTPASNV